MKMNSYWVITSFKGRLETQRQSVYRRYWLAQTWKLRLCSSSWIVRNLYYLIELLFFLPSRERWAVASTGGSLSPVAGSPSQSWPDLQVGSPPSPATSLSDTVTAAITPRIPTSTDGGQEEYMQATASTGNGDAASHPRLLEISEGTTVPGILLCTRRRGGLLFPHDWCRCCGTATSNIRGGTFGGGIDPGTSPHLHWG